MCRPYRKRGEPGMEEENALTRTIHECRRETFEQATEKLLWHAGNSMARTSRTTEEHRAGSSKRPSSKAAESEEAKAYASVR